MKHPAFKGQVYIHLLPPDRTMIDGRVVELGREYKASKRYLLHGVHAAAPELTITPYAYIKSEMTRYLCIAPSMLADVKEGKRPLHCGFGVHALDLGHWKSGWWTSHSGEKMEAYPKRGRWLCVVRIWGNVQKEENVVVGLRRKVLAMRQIDWSDTPDLKYSSTHSAIDWVLENPYNGVVIR